MDNKNFKRSKSQTYEREPKGKILEREGSVFRYPDGSQMDGALNYLTVSRGRDQD